MARGPKKHLKRLAAPKHWMLDKLSGTWAPRPSTGPHKLRECLPLMVLLRNRLKYALNRREVISILMQRHVKVDGVVRTDTTYPSGFMDVIQLPATLQNFRLLLDTKGRFAIHTIQPDEANFKLCKVRKISLGLKGIPFLTTHDGRTVRYPDPSIRVNDTIKFDLEEKKIVDFVKYEVGNLSYVTGGRNIGRIGKIVKIEKHPGSFEIVHLEDLRGHQFVTRVANVFVIGKGEESLITLPKSKGIKLSIAEERQHMFEHRAQQQRRQNHH